MRELTFKGYLADYVRSLSRSGSLDMKTLAEDAASGNTRLQAPLLLYAVKTGREKALLKHLRAGDVGKELLDVLQALNSENLETRLQEKTLPEKYNKVWDSYMVRHNTPKRDEELKNAMRIKLLEMMKQKNCSKYRLYTDLHLNPGNINSWLKSGDSRKVSYQTASRMMDYLINY